MNREDQIFMVARAMARSDGFDPDQPCVECTPTLAIRGKNIAIGPTIQIWQLYSGLATAAVNELCAQEGISK